MYSVEVDVSGPLKTVTRMIRTVNHFKRVDLGTVMSDWQVEDMHRKRPFTMRSRARGIVRTVVRPHSRYEVNRSRKAQRRIARQTKRKGFLTSMASFYRKWSTRPILRAEMYAALGQRMTEEMHKLIVWKK